MIDLLIQILLDAEKWGPKAIVALIAFFLSIPTALITIVTASIKSFSWWKERRSKKRRSTLAKTPSGSRSIIHFLHRICEVIIDLYEALPPWRPENRLELLGNPELMLQKMQGETWRVSRTQFPMSNCEWIYDKSVLSL